MIESKKSLVQLRGMKDGLVLQLNDTCSFEELKSELVDEFRKSHYQNAKDKPTVDVNIHTGHRYITESMREELMALILKESNMLVQEIVSDVISVAHAETIYQDTQMHAITRTIRSGQVVRHNGDVFLVGDVNPGARLEATGSIYILGALRGVACAGVEGNRQAVIAASVMNPTQLYIEKEHFVFEEHHRIANERTTMECAYLNELNQIAVRTIREVKIQRPEILPLERGL
ncbi:MAG: septum site-determining protein MinC [Bacilli bacterium]